MISEGHIIYPRIWEYLIITNDKSILEKEIENNFRNLRYDFSLSKSSKNNKYYSFNFRIQVMSESERNHIFQLLVKINGVKTVI